jgi:hypothetical protein
MILKKLIRKTAIAVGQVYEHLRDDAAIEIATVTGVRCGPLGIPHVCYELAVIQSGGIDDLGGRILTQAKFNDRFRPIPPALAA